MKKITLKTIATISIIATLLSINSCSDCYTCQAKRDGNMVDFNKECGSSSEKSKMETEFRKQYPDSIYFVTCN
jgi:hypothetical protein